MNCSVGELARRCGLTVRALHHYEKLGLHRLLALREAGLALKEVGPLLQPSPVSAQ